MADTKFSTVVAANTALTAITEDHFLPIVTAASGSEPALNRKMAASLVALKSDLGAGSIVYGATPPENPVIGQRYASLGHETYPDGLVFEYGRVPNSDPVVIDWYFSNGGAVATDIYDVFDPNAVQPPVTSTPDQMGNYYDAPLATFLAAIDQTKFDAIYDLGAPTEAQALVNLINPGTFNLTKVGTVTHQPGIGMNSDGSTGYLDCNFSPTTATKFTQNSASVHLFETGAPSIRHVFGLAASDHVRLGALSTSGLSGRINGTNTLINSSYSTDAKSYSLSSVVRDTATTATVYLDGAVGSAETGNSSSAPRTDNFNIFRSNGEIAIATQVARLVIIGASLDQTEITALFNAVRAFVDATGPRRFILLPAGQSNMDRLFRRAASDGSGDDSLGSEAAERIIIPFLQAALDAEYNDGRPNKLAVANGAVGGSSVLIANTATDKYWWDSVNDAPIGVLLDWEDIYDGVWNSKERAIATKQIAWAQGEADADEDLVEYKLSTQQVFAHMRSHISDADAPIVFHPIGRNQELTTLLTTVRTIQGEIAAADANIHMGPDTFDIERINAFDWHAVNDFNIGNSVAVGYDRMAEYVARSAAYYFGCVTVYNQGPLVTGASLVDSTTVDVTVSYPAATVSGRDYTPITDIVGFVIRDSVGDKTISSAVRVNSTTIRLTLTTGLGTSPEWGFNPNIDSIDITDVPRDNAAFPMPFQFVKFTSFDGGDIPENVLTDNDGNPLTDNDGNYLTYA